MVLKATFDFLFGLNHVLILKAVKFEFLTAWFMLHSLWDSISKD